MTKSSSGSGRGVLIVHPEYRRAATVGHLVERAGVSWDHRSSIAGTSDVDRPLPWDAVIVFESIFSEGANGSVHDLRPHLPEGVVLIGLIESNTIAAPTLFGAGVDLIQYEPLVLADIERALAFAQAVHTESRQQARDRLRKMTALHELAVASGHRTGSPGWLDRLVEAGSLILGADALAMWSIDRENDQIRCIGSAGLDRDYIARAEEKSPALLDVYEQLPRELSTNWLTANETSSSFRLVAPEAAREIGIKQIAWLPVRDSNRLYGHLSFYFMSEATFEQYDLVLADALASIVAAALGTLWLQTEIRRSNRLYREHVESSPDGVVVCHLDGTVERSNPAVEQITGRDQYEVIGQSIVDWFLPPDDLPWDEWSNLASDTPAAPVELWLSRKNGERRRVSCYARRLTFPDPWSLESTEQRVQLVFQDVTSSARRLVELELFHDLSRLMSGRGSLEEAYELVSSRLYNYLNYRIVTVGEVDSTDRTLRGYRNYLSSEATPVEFQVNSGLCGVAFRENRSILAQDVSQSTEYLEYDERVVSEAVAVIRSEGAPVGLLDIQVDETQPLDDGALQFAESIAAHLGLLIEQITIRERLELQAMTDPLTGIANRRALIHHLHALAGDPNSPPSAFLLVELDNFKGVNDQFGHLFGDEMLKQVARRLRTALREGDLLARYGGDEIAMVFHGVSAEQAVEIAERLRGVISSEPFVFNGHSTTITVSIGIALYPMHGKSTDELIGEADRAMYAAKLGGRNSVHMDIARAD